MSSGVQSYLIKQVIQAENIFFYICWKQSWNSAGKVEEKYLFFQYSFFNLEDQTRDFLNPNLKF